MNLGNFDKQARAAHRQVVAQAEEAIRSVALDAYTTLQEDAKESDVGSPIASGRYVSSMRVGINQIDPSSEPEDPNYRYPTEGRDLPPRTINNRAVARVSALLRTFKLGDTIFLSNSVPYARRIERDGHSWQAPDGVFEPTFRKVIARFRNLNLRIRRV